MLLLVISIISLGINNLVDISFVLSGRNNRIAIAISVKIAVGLAGSRYRWVTAIAVEILLSRRVLFRRHKV